MVNWVKTLTQPQWRVEVGACLGLHESLDGRPQFPGNDCAFSSLLESYLLSPSTWDGHVKHGLRPLRSRPAAHAARQLTHISANKYEAWGNWLLLVRNAGGMCQTGNPESKITSRAGSSCFGLWWVCKHKRWLRGLCGIATAKHTHPPMTRKCHSHFLFK